MRLLIVTPLLPPEPGGPSYYAVHLKDTLTAKGYEVSVVAFRDVRKYPSVVRHIVFFFKVFAKAWGVDELIILDTVSVALPAVLAGKLVGKRTVIRVGGDFVWERFIERTGEKVLLSEFYTKKRELTFKERMLIVLQKHIILRLATNVVFNTAWQRELWKGVYKLSDTKTGVITNACKKGERVYEGGDTFLCAWRPTAFKNTDTLEAAFKEAKEKCPGIGLTIYKDIPREELHEHMKHARALVVPSLTELSPNMALEALGMGLPVLLTKDCGARDILDGAVVWIDPLDPHDIAEKLCMLMDSSQYEKIKESTKAFSYSKTYDEIADEFLVLLKR